MSTIRHISLGVLVSLLVVTVGCGGDSNDDTGGGEAGFTPAQGGFGARLDPGQGYAVVLLVAEPRSGVVDYVGVACAAGGTLSTPVRVEENVELDGSTFNAESEDVAIEGEFVSATEAEGTIRDPSADAQACGLSDGDAWTSSCELTVEAEEVEQEEGGLVLGDSSGTTDGGTAYAYLEIATSDGRRLTAESGSCSGGSG